jgi:hypothetical protein
VGAGPVGLKADLGGQTRINAVLLNMPIFALMPRYDPTRWRTARQPHGELANSADLALDLDRSAVMLQDDIPADRQPKVGPVAGRFGGGWNSFSLVSRGIPRPLSRTWISTSLPSSCVVTSRCGVNFGSPVSLPRWLAA